MVNCTVSSAIVSLPSARRKRRSGASPARSRTGVPLGVFGERSRNDETLTLVGAAPGFVRTKSAFGVVSVVIIGGCFARRPVSAGAGVASDGVGAGAVPLAVVVTGEVAVA